MTTTIAIGDAVKVNGHGGIAWRVRSWATERVPVLCYVEEDEDTIEGEYETGEYEDVEDRTRVVCRMIGDDRDYTFELDELTPIDDDDFCHECGQIGCTFDGRERD